MSVEELHDAAEVGNLLQVRRLLQKEMVDVNTRFGWRELTALHVAALYGQSEVLQLLIASNVDINAKDKYGDTALHLAALYGQSEAVQLLIASNADINAKDNRGDIPFHCVRSPEMAKLFLEKPPLSTNGVPCICRDQLVAKNTDGLTRLNYWISLEEVDGDAGDDGGNDAMDDAEDYVDEDALDTYLLSYTDLPLAVPAASLTPTGEVAVRINPKLTEFQRKLAEEFFKKSADVVLKLFEENKDDDSDPSDGEPRFFLPDNVRCVIIGHLALADIMFLDEP